jgi:hypothetical protein
MELVPISITASLATSTHPFVWGHAERSDLKEQAGNCQGMGVLIVYYEQGTAPTLPADGYCPPEMAYSLTTKRTLRFCRMHALVCSKQRGRSFP